MLKYNINLKETLCDITYLEANSFSFENIEYDGNDKIMVRCNPSSEKDMAYDGEILTITRIQEIENDCDDDGDLNDIQSLNATVISHNNELLYYYFKAPRYRFIELSSISEAEENNKNYWVFVFDNGHLFSSDNDIKLILQYGTSTSQIMEISDVVYSDCKTLYWEVDDTIDNFAMFKYLIFGLGSGVSERIKIKRNQTLFSEDFSPDFDTTPSVSVSRPKVKIEIPFQKQFDSTLYKQESINGEFITKETLGSIPSSVNMEKMIYYPIIYDGTNYSPVTKINFNLHFREHNGDDWTVKDSDGWNFSKYGKSASSNYYSYPSWVTSNQADLLGYLGFTNKDVQYQKKKLEKSFIRLSFYDSPNPMNQNLLSYSSVFFDINKLYSKFIKCQKMDNWYVNPKDDDTKYSRISTNFEVYKNSGSVVPSTILSDQENIENYRLSSQLSVKDKYSSNTSSEGFYLYLWDDNFTNVPESLYMKVEFNHAGYGRTIPMMMPYFIDEVETKPERDCYIKTNNEIISDWNGIGYGMIKYNAYSYIKLKYLYNEYLKKYIYYLDPDVYGIVSGPVLNINLYEARVTL